MQLMYFAHNGVEHATKTEARSHELTSDITFIGMTLLVVGVALAAVYFLSKPRPKHKRMAHEHHEPKED